MKSAMNFEEYNAMKEKRNKKLKSSKDKLKYTEDDDMSVLIKKKSKKPLNQKRVVLRIIIKIINMTMKKIFMNLGTRFL
ncbi:hypothetical protein LEQ06_17865 [Paraclostridium sp. AKS46]|nr:hypothetical protein [Paraclostridium sp. AKS46]